ncbi:MAG: hypothetical protein R3D59_12045 [Paracoccaceae bacterium]
MLVTTLGSDPHRPVSTGRGIRRLKVGATVQAISRIGRRSNSSVSKILAFAASPRPRSRKPSPATSSRSPACSRRPPWRTRSARWAVDQPLDAQPIDPPTITVTLRHQRTARSPGATARRCRAG